MALNITLQEEEDERAAQVLKDFDSLFHELSEGIAKFELTRPALFLKEPDHTCINFFNKGREGQEGRKQEKEEKKKNSASNLILHLVEHNKLSILTYKKGKGFEGNKT